MKVNTETINHIAKLAKLKFTDTEAATFVEEFEKILTHLENMDGEDLVEVSLNTFEAEKSVLRKDEMEVFEEKKELFQNVKEMKENYMVVPKVIE
ncbi:Asp-tRNA(Asn)/Glu-tRNA(Gln) amidotransferase subunit GatC [Crassaminicella profunda]|uniref:Asp-tRNA(Asn)/Glu-tRNA(Gln) amidotransferase subunit GatC n=1 Tax=Crassaminicella profunda TaxID=1286698 RepID=UPI001CA6C402|nr:Asp-tRNA(Asn)/Glu-tRNA(Gln) amidotransferase subunit GatC [Crassaminicella profunda]QZY54015.1 Asp-tRNA(Asn)/Glu-tRNA(Gln) amidotransferase subunit GatC [Crassaminicella profunda]